MVWINWQIPTERRRIAINVKFIIRQNAERKIPENSEIYNDTVIWAWTVMLWQKHKRQIDILHENDAEIYFSKASFEHLALFTFVLFIPPASTKCTGITLSVCPSVDRIVFALYLQQYWSDPFHICTPYQATSEGVSHVMPVSKLKKNEILANFLNL